MAGKTSQSQHETGPSSAQGGPLPFPIPGMEILRDLQAQGSERMEGFLEELSKFEASSDKRLQEASGRFAQLFADTVRYGLDQAAAWRQSSLEMMRQTAEAMRSRAA